MEKNTCSKCRHLGTFKLKMQEYTFSGAFVRQWYECEICAHVRKNIVRTGRHDLMLDVIRPIIPIADFTA